MSSPEKSYRGYAEDYTVRVEADRPLLEMAGLNVHRALDLGTGTGTGIEDLIDMKVVIEPYRIIGVDLDENNLEKARQNRHLKLQSGSSNEIVIQKGDAEDLREIPSNSQQLILCRNLIHLLRINRALPEMYRILEPGGIVLTSTGYMRDKMYPAPEQRTKLRWGFILGIAYQILINEHGYQRSDIPEPDIPDKYSSEDLKVIFEETGFVNIQSQDRVVELPPSAIAGLIRWGGFAKGAIPIKDVDLARKVMLEAIRSPKLRGKTFPRGFFYLRAEKAFKS